MRFHFVTSSTVIFACRTTLLIHDVSADSNKYKWSDDDYGAYSSFINDDRKSLTATTRPSETVELSSNFSYLDTRGHGDAHGTHGQELHRRLGSQDEISSNTKGEGQEGHGNSHSEVASHASSTDAAHGSSHGEHHHAHYVLLFLFFSLFLGLTTMHFISRHFHGCPFTVAIFIEGVVLGVLHEVTDGALGQLSLSLDMWLEIDPHLLLYAFLPALLFGDSMGMSWHDFKRCALQCVILAGPGTVIGCLTTAFFMMYVLPLGWDFPTCCAFGSILAATDPVAVVALLKEMGVSKTLTMQIAGESLLNDGLAIVLWTVFFNMMKGETYTVMEVLMIFCRLAFGGVLFGQLFGWVSVWGIAHASDKLAHMDHLIQLSLTICCAYLGFFVSEGAAGFSGVLATIFSALFLAKHAWPLFTSREAIEHFWHTCEFIGNSVLFILAGAIFGQLAIHASGRDWLLLFIVYIGMLAIRGFMLILLSPILSRIGYGATWKEFLIMWWGGLRGAVGLALALAMRKDPQVPEEVGVHITFFVAGAAALTMLINATTCGKLINFLEISTPPEARRRLIQKLRFALAKEITRIYTLMCTWPMFSEEWIEESFVKQAVSALRLRENVLLRMLGKHSSSHNRAMLKDILVEWRAQCTTGTANHAGPPPTSAFGGFGKFLGGIAQIFVGTDSEGPDNVFEDKFDREEKGRASFHHLHKQKSFERDNQEPQFIFKGKKSQGTKSLDLNALKKKKRQSANKDEDNKDQVTDEANAGSTSKRKSIGVVPRASVERKSIEIGTRMDAGRKSIEGQGGQNATSAFRAIQHRAYRASLEAEMMTVLGQGHETPLSMDPTQSMGAHFGEMGPVRSVGGIGAPIGGTGRRASIGMDIVPPTMPQRQSKGGRRRSLFDEDGPPGTVPIEVGHAKSNNAGNSMPSWCDQSNGFFAESMLDISGLTADNGTQQSPAAGNGLFLSPDDGDDDDDPKKSNFGFKMVDENEFSEHRNHEESEGDFMVAPTISVKKTKTKEDGKDGNHFSDLHFDGETSPKHDSNHLSRPAKGGARERERHQKAHEDTSNQHTASAAIKTQAQANNDYMLSSANMPAFGATLSIAQPVQGSSSSKPGGFEDDNAFGASMTASAWGQQSSVMDWRQRKSTVEDKLQDSVGDESANSGAVTLGTAEIEEDELKVERELFLSMLRSEYWSQMETGRLPDNSLACARLLRAVDEAADTVRTGLSDWDRIVSKLSPISRLKDSLPDFVQQLIKCWYWLINLPAHGVGFKVYVPVKKVGAFFDVITCVCFVDAHLAVQQKLTSGGVLGRVTAARLQVLMESYEEVELVWDFLDKNCEESHIVETRSKQLAISLLKYEKNLVDGWMHTGIITSSEAHELLHEGQHDLVQLESHKHFPDDLQDMKRNSMNEEEEARQKMLSSSIDDDEVDLDQIISEHDGHGGHGGGHGGRDSKRSHH